MDKNLIETERGSERNFGVTFSVVFAVIGGYVSWRSGEIKWWIFTASAIMLFAAFATPRLLRRPNELWFKFGMLLGGIVAPVVMAIVYILTFLPMGLFVRLSGKDLLSLRLNSNQDSYWIKRETQPYPMKNQF